MVFYEKARAEDADLGDLIIQAGTFVQEVDANQSPLKASGQETSLLGGGFLGLQAGVARWMSLEANIQYGQVQYLRRTLSQDVLIEKVDRIQVPILFRFWLVSWFSLAVGPYASYRVGTVNGKVLPISNSEKTSAHDTGEHGLIGDISFAMHTKLYETYLLFSYRRTYSLTPRGGEAREWNQVVFAIERRLPGI